MASAPDKILRLGFIGAGFVGQLGHLQNYLSNPRVALTAVAEARPHLCEAVRQRYGFAKAYASAEALLDDPDVDAVVAVTARPNTGPLALRVLNAGKHLLTEKPMCATLAQADRLVEAADKAGVVYQVAYNRRHDVGVRQGLALYRELVASRELGALNYVRYHVFTGDSYHGISGHVTTTEPLPTDFERWPMAPEWMAESARPGYEHFINPGSHFINLLRWFLPDLAQVDFATLDNRRSQLVVFRHESKPAILEMGDFGFSGWDECVEFYFDRGRLRIEYPAPFLRTAVARVELYRSGSEPIVVAPQNPPRWAFALQAEAFVDAILDGAPNMASGADAREDMRLIETVWRKASSAENRAR